MNVICTKNAPAAVGPYSQAIDCGDLVFLSGQIPLVPETGLVAKGGLEAQAHQMFANIQAVLAEAGMSLSNVVKTTVFMTDLSQFAAFNAIYAEYFKAPYPARSCVEVSALPKGVLVECELIARR
ncbi:endoribonuclease L-PSP [Firmicutes bacterium CAG:170]|nr:endoribonuclease L-PSP [Firmicutes bacterium CAG:170]